MSEECHSQFLIESLPKIFSLGSFLPQNAMQFDIIRITMIRSKYLNFPKINRDVTKEHDGCSDNCTCKVNLDFSVVYPVPGNMTSIFPLFSYLHAVKH